MINDIIKRDKFPIDTTDVLATSGKEGLCPIFDVDIVVQKDNLNNPISEKGIRKELDKFDPSVTYESIPEPTTATILSSTFNILHSHTEELATYNNLFFENGGLVSLENDVLFLSGFPTTGYQTTAEIVSAYISGKCVGGGNFQYSETIELKNLVSEYKIADVMEDNVIGKIFINCMEKPEDKGQSYYIGMNDGKVKLTLPFSAPTGEGLVDFCYGPDLVTEHYWNYKNSKMYLYSNGGQERIGKFGISVFYDKVIWKPSFGYIRPEMVGDTWARFNLNNDLYKQSDRGGISHNGNTLGSIVSDSNIYTAGGTYNNNYTSVIEKYLTKSDTSTTIFANHLSETKMIDCATFSPSNIYGYFFGGYNLNGVLSTIEEFDYKGNVSVNKGNMNIKRMYSSCGGNNKYVYIAGGTDDLVSYKANNIIEKIKLSSTTPSILVATLNKGKCMHNSFSQNQYIYWNQGIDGDKMVNNQDKFDTNTETLFSTISPFVVKNLIGTFSLQQEKDGYIVGGSFFDGKPQYNSNRNNTIQKYKFSNNTVYVIDNVFYNNTNSKYSNWRTTSNSV